VMGKNHARVLSEFGYLSAIVDANEEKAKETAKKFGVQYSKDFVCECGEKLDDDFKCPICGKKYPELSKYKEMIK